MEKAMPQRTAAELLASLQTPEYAGVYTEEGSPLVMNAETGAIRQDAQIVLEADAPSSDNHELSSEQVDEALHALANQYAKDDKTILKEGYERQKGIKEKLPFADVEKYLMAPNHKEDLWALYNMVKAGARPDILEDDEGSFLIGEAFDQLIADRANCVYDADAEEEVGSENCNGNAVDRADSCGESLMPWQIFEKYFKGLLPSSCYCYDYLQTDVVKRKTGAARYAYRDVGGAYVHLSVARRHCDDLGWRGARRVQKN